MSTKDLCRLTKFRNFSVITLLLVLIATANAITNNRVTRIVDMNGPNIKQVTSIEFTNDSDQDIDSYILLPVNGQADNLAYIEAKHNNKVLDITYNEAQKGGSISQDYYTAKFSEPLAAGKSTKIVVTEEYIRRKDPFPSRMRLKDDPIVRVADDAYYQSYYPTRKMKSTFDIGSSATLKEYTSVEGGEARGREIKYGLYKEVEPMKSHPIFILVKYDDPIPIFTEVNRKITLSHWKPINVDEEYKLTNSIAELEGGFSRMDYNPYQVRYAINNLDCELPKDTKDLYYTDEIGNITTSHAYRHSKHVKFEISPRFPLMGGWKTYWRQGYTLPNEHYISGSESSGQYRFEINLSHPYNDIAAEEFYLKIVLPEGATDVDLELPFQVDSIEKETVFQYLDLRGRNSIIINKKNVIEKYHDQKVVVTYKLTQFDLMIKPIILIFYSFCALLFAFVFYRLATQNKTKVKVE